ncbi:MAG: cadmium-translocating P-type ATPase [Clostridia bacterium]|nr:cadmium-translocating P-type ATPase [Clostridia bacterium]
MNAHGQKHEIHCDSCEHHHEDEELSTTNKILLVVGVILAVVAHFIPFNIASIMLFVIAYIMIGYDIILKAIKHLFGKDMFDENLIMTIATIGAMAIGEYTEAVAVLVLYKIGEILQDKAVDSSKEKIEKVLDLKENETTLITGEKVHTEDVKVGTQIMIKTGDRVPIDSILESENATLDMSALNGESLHVEKTKGQEILSGSINAGGAITVKTIREEKDSAVSQIVELVENAAKNKSKTEKYISKFCKIYTPVVIILAILVILVLPLAFNLTWSEAIYRALNFLVISCPCALVISIPLGFFVGMGAASKKGILAKGTTYLDTLTKVNEIYMDKTGTLTDGKFKVNSYKSKSELADERILELVAYAEYKSSHVIAKSVLEAYKGIIDESKIQNHEELPGFGITAKIDNIDVLVGNSKLMENNNIKYIKNTNSGTAIYLSVNGEYKGYVTLEDSVKLGAREAIQKLKNKGIKTFMLTGDREYIAKEVAGKLGVDEVYYELLPQDKVRIIEEAKQRGATVAFVGDGINDSPVIATSDVGFAMGKGTDIAVDTADIILMTDEPEKIVDAINISRRTKHIVNENIAMIITAKVLFLILSVFGLTNMWIAVFADVGVTLISIFNSLRIFKVKK